MTKKCAPCVFLLVLLPAAIHAQATDVSALLRRCSEMQIARWEGVTHYLVDQTMMGNRVTLAFERFNTTGPDGNTHPAFRPMRENGPFTSAELRVFANAADSVGTSISSQMEQSGFPSGLLGGAGQDPWASTDPRVMMGGAATFVRAAADAQDANEREKQASVGEASRALDDTAEFFSRARLVGTEQITTEVAGTNGTEARSSYHLLADGLSRRVSSQDGGQAVIDAVNLWIDTRECVPLRLLMTGTMTSGGASRPITIERIDSRYRLVAGSKMYEPHKQVMRLKGVLTPEQEHQMTDATARLADLESRLQQLPPGQGDMILKQMEPQLRMMKGLATGGGFEIVTDVHAITVNPTSADLQQLRTTNTLARGAGAGPGGMMSNSAAPAATTTSAAAAFGTPASATGPQPATDPPTAQQDCLQRKIQQQQDSQKKKRGMGRLLGALGQVASRLGGTDVARAVGDVNTAGATAGDLVAAARELGITEDEIADCQESAGSSANGADNG